MVLKSFIKSVTTSKQRVALKRFKRHAFEIFLKKNKTSLEDIKKILIDNLGIKKNGTEAIKWDMKTIQKKRLMTN